VLQRSFGGAAMTVAEATLIADAALEATVRTVLDALLASEILKSTRGESSALAGLPSCCSNVDCTVVEVWHLTSFVMSYVRSSTGCRSSMMSLTAW